MYHEVWSAFTTGPCQSAFLFTISPTLPLRLSSGSLRPYRHREPVRLLFWLLATFGRGSRAVRKCGPLSTCLLDTSFSSCIDFVSSSFASTHSSCVVISFSFVPFLGLNLSFFSLSLSLSLCSSCAPFTVCVSCTPVVLALRPFLFSLLQPPPD